jgi:outer membrane lipoprotein-sorting protein
MHRPSLSRTLLLLIAFLPLVGCAFRTSHLVPKVNTNDIQKATLDELVSRIDNDANRLKTFIAYVDIHFSTGGKKKGLVTEYTDVNGYILVRKPENMRMIVKAPVVGNNLLDMVSNGKTFEVSFPPKNQFFVGSNQLVGTPSDKPLESLRPQAIMDALLLQPIDPENEIAVLEQGTLMALDLKTHKEAEEPDYVVLVLSREPSGGYVLSRKIIFSREDLRPHAQYIYDRQAQLVTSATYENFTDHNGVLFPDIIDIQRPVEEYSFRLTVTSLRVNEQLVDAQFVLAQPPGSKLINLDNRNTSADTRTESKQDLGKGPE